MTQSGNKPEHEFGTYKPPEANYNGYTTQSLYLPMRDGVRLAVQYHLPGGLRNGDRIPALLQQSRYWRDMELRAPFKWLFKADDLNPRFRNLKPFFCGQGYALVLVDIRGTGASFGTWPYPWHEDTITDSYEIVEWIVSQPWSNGKVGTFGISYLGTTAELLPVCGHPAVKAVIPMFNHPDAYVDISFPGGIFNDRFIHDWGKMDSYLDKNRLPRDFGRIAQLMVKGVMPVAGSENELWAAVDEHGQNARVYSVSKEITFRDEVHSSIGACVEDFSMYKYVAEQEESQAVICGWGSWMDAGTADAVIRRFLTLEKAYLGVIGAWEHGGQFNASPYRSQKLPANPPPEIQWREMVRFFDIHLKDNQNRDEGLSQRTLFYYTMGEEKWKSTQTWPPVGTKQQVWYLSNGHALVLEKPQVENGEDLYKVDFSATSGPDNRWYELGSLLNRTVRYKKRAEAGRTILTYLTPPLKRDIEISGYPVVQLYISSTETDGAIFVYLEDVDESGNVTYVTEGQLRALHRKVSGSAPPYMMQVPYHTFKVADAMPLVPGEIAELHFGLLPTSVLIRKGHRLRLGIACHDEGTFTRIPTGGEPEIRVLRENKYTSNIRIPTIEMT